MSCVSRVHFPRNPSVRRVRLRVLGSLDLCSLQGGPAVRSAGAKRPGRQPLSTKSWAGRQPASLGGPGFERSAHIPGVGRCAAATALALSLSQCTHSQTHTHHSVHSPSLSLRGGALSHGSARILSYPGGLRLGGLAPFPPAPVWAAIAEAVLSRTHIHRTHRRTAVRRR